MSAEKGNPPHRIQEGRGGKAIYVRRVRPSTSEAPPVPPRLNPGDAKRPRLAPAGPTPNQKNARLQGSFEGADDSEEELIEQEPGEVWVAPEPVGTSQASSTDRQKLIRDPLRLGERLAGLRARNPAKRESLEMYRMERTIGFVARVDAENLRRQRESGEYCAPGPSHSRNNPYLYDIQRRQYERSPPRFSREEVSHRHDDFERDLEHAWNEGHVDVFAMGKVVFAAKLGRQFSERTLEKFFDSKVQNNNFVVSHSNSYTSASYQHGLADNFAAYMEGNNIMTTILMRSQMKMEASRNEPTETASPEPVPSPSNGVQSPSFEVSPRFLTKVYKIQGDEEFKDVNLSSLVSNFVIMKSLPNTIALTSVFRKCLKHICNFPPNIKKYTLRLTTRGNRAANLLDLPKHIKDVLEEFGLGLANLDHDELLDEPPEGYQNSKFYQSLGSTPSVRLDVFTGLKSRRKWWMLQVPILLRNALRDVRLHDVKEQMIDGKPTYTWTSHKKKNVQNTLDQKEDVNDE